MGCPNENKTEQLNAPLLILPSQLISVPRLGSVLIDDELAGRASRIPAVDVSFLVDVLALRALLLSCGFHFRTAPTFS